jgi:hypothetical protein
VTIVIIEDGKQTTLTGRVAAMVRWLLKNAERLASNDKIQVTFDCAGSTVLAETRKREPISDAPAFLR